MRAQLKTSPAQPVVRTKDAEHEQLGALRGIRLNAAAHLTDCSVVTCALVRTEFCDCMTGSLPPMVYAQAPYEHLL